MLCDGVNDLFNALVKIFLEKDEAKQVYFNSIVRGCTNPHFLAYFDA